MLNEKGELQKAISTELVNTIALTEKGELKKLIEVLIIL